MILAPFFMTKRIVDYDPFTGMTTTFDYDHATDRTIIGTEQDVSVVLEANRRLANDESYTRGGMKDSWLHVGCIPNVVIEKWKNEKGVDVFNKDHAKAVCRLLESPEYKYLKTTTARTYIPR